MYQSNFEILILSLTLVLLFIITLSSSSLYGKRYYG